MSEAKSEPAYREPATKVPQKPYIGGQALLEGVMMRSPASLAMVVRRRDGSLHVRERPIKDYRRGLAKVPFIRGVASFGESLRLGHEALRFSAEQLEKDMEATEREKEAAAKAGGSGKAKDGAKAASKVKSAASTLASIGSSVGTTLGTFATQATTLYSTFNFGLATLVMTSDPTSDSDPSASSGAGGEKKSGGGMGFVLVLMVLFIWALPQIAAALVKRAFHLEANVQSPLFQAITGVFKLTIVITYMLFIRRTQMVRRMFQYHGAEHKTISCYEAELPLTVPNAREKTTLHPRCGTTFLVMVALVSVLVFTGLGAVLPKIDTGSELKNNLIFFLVKLPFIPVIAGLTFEIQRVFARYCTTGLLRALLWPGFLVQKITTIEPDDEQLEVALASLRATLFRENGESSDSNADVRFPTYEDIAQASRLRKAA
jgi:uncharacterized protein YqhQ